MMRATVDLMSLYQFDNTVLDLLEAPEGIDKDLLKNNLILESAELELLYPNATFLKTAIGLWSKKQLHVWEELLNTTQYDYNPIWNKDGKITEERDLTNKEDTKDNVDRVDALQDKNTRDFKDKEERDFEDKETRDLEGSDLNSVYGFNSDSDAPANKNDTTDSGTDTFEHTGSGTTSHTGTDTFDHTGRQDIDRTIDKTVRDTGKVVKIEQGNIGVTSTQSLILEQRSVVEFNIYNVIIHDFIDRFCLKLY